MMDAITKEDYQASMVGLLKNILADISGALQQSARSTRTLLTVGTALDIVDDIFSGAFQDGEFMEFDVAGTPRRTEIRTETIPQTRENVDHDFVIVHLDIIHDIFDVWFPNILREKYGAQSSNSIKPEWIAWAFKTNALAKSIFESAVTIIPGISKEDLRRTLREDKRVVAAHMFLDYCRQESFGAVRKATGSSGISAYTAVEKALAAAFRTHKDVQVQMRLLDYLRKRIMPDLEWTFEKPLTDGLRSIIIDELEGHFHELLPLAIIP